MYCTCALTNLCKRKEILLYINGTQELFTRGNLNHKKTPLVELFGISYVYAVFCTGLSFPLAFVFGFHLTNPCKPSFAGVSLLPQCQSNHIQEWSTFEWWLDIILRLGLYTWNLWIFMFGLNAATFVADSLMILTIQMMRRVLSG